MSPIVEATPQPMAQLPLPKADPCVIVIFGALGDLTKRKLVPALFHLACSDCTSGQFKVLGAQPSSMARDGAQLRPM
jgi:glucose-6-phosphate 1-dehydrogenase